MKKYLFFIHVFSFMALNALSQTDFDIRKTKWGMTIAEVKSSEEPMTASKEEKTNSGTQIELQYDNVIVSDVKTTIIYTFENGRLVEISYRFDRTWQGKEMNLTAKVMATQFVFKSLIDDKKMKVIQCWSYGLKTYGQYTGKNNCGYTSTELISDIEKVGLQNKEQYVNFHLNNNRTYANIQFKLVDNDPIFKEIIGWVTFSAFGDAEKSSKGSGF